MTSLSRGVLAASFLAIVPVAARAGNGGFFSTYDSEVEEGELELMLMNDLTRPSALHEGFNPYASHMLELEYGVTSKFAAELMVESYEDLRARATEFTGYRVEARYRLFEDQVPLNPMLYAEYEDLGPNSRFKMEVSGFVRTPYAQREEAGGRERVLETRLVLSQRVGAFDLAANWINESNLGGGPTAFGYTLGVMWMPGHAGHSMQRNSAGAHAHETSAAENGATAGYSCPMHPGVTSETPGSCPKCGMKLQRREPEREESRPAASSSGCACGKEMNGCSCAHCSGKGGACSCAHGGSWGFGLEAFGGLGDTRAFGIRPAFQEHYLGPIVMYHFSPRWMAHAQVAKGLTRASDDLVRLNVGYEF